MNDMMGAERREASHESAFNFTGDWREFLPIALTNLLLTIVTLGIYRFWAKARERRYLWSRSHFIDDAFEWTGTGKEMFVGFLIVMLVFIPMALLFTFGMEALILRGQVLAAGLLVLGLYVGFFYLVGVGSFRALRYRLSRTYWHGIRGGSEDGGWEYGRRWVLKMAGGFLPLGLLVPWAMTSLWNDRWSRMSFGQYSFETEAGADGLWARWLLIYLAPVIAFVVVALGLGAAAAAGEQAAAAAGFIVAFAGILLFYVAFLLLSLSYYAAFYRQVAAATSVAGLHFEFGARTKDWLKLILGNIGLVIVTLGIGFIFLGYRNWSFIVRHMEASGEVHLDTLLQSRAPAPGDAEGLADAFDIGAI